MVGRALFTISPITRHFVSSLTTYLFEYDFIIKK